MTADPLEALRAALASAGAQDRSPTCLATVSTVTASGVTVLFDGETVVSARAYMVTSGVLPSVGARVVMLRVGSTWVVVGTVGAAPGAFNEYRTWTPNPVPETGAFAVVSVLAARYAMIGDTCLWGCAVQVTTLGTGGGALRITLPATPLGNVQFFGAGRETQATGVELQVFSAGGATASSLRYDNASWLASGRTCHLAGQFEVA